jgi:hypothetical protein
MIPIVSSKLHSNTFRSHVCEIKCAIMKQMFQLNSSQHKNCIDKCNKDATK